MIISIKKLVGVILMQEKFNAVQNNSELVAELSEKVVVKYTEDLDNIMKKLNAILIGETPPTTDELERYLLLLTNTLYFVGEQAEHVGVFDDVGKATFKDAYNKAYLESISMPGKDGKKPTVAEITATAETQVLEDSIVSNIYTRAYKLFKFKVDAAYEMVKSISKIISKRMSEQATLPETSTRQILNEQWETL